MLLSITKWTTKWLTQLSVVSKPQEPIQSEYFSITTAKCKWFMQFSGLTKSHKPLQVDSSLWASGTTSVFFNHNHLKVDFIIDGSIFLGGLCAFGVVYITLHKYTGNWNFWSGLVSLNCINHLHFAVVIEKYPLWSGFWGLETTLNRVNPLVVHFFIDRSIL